MCFLDATELFVKANLGFLQKSSKDHFLEKKAKIKKGEIKFLNGNYQGCGSGSAWIHIHLPFWIRIQRLKKQYKNVIICDKL